MSSGRIFISYRRRLDQGTTGRLYDRLERHYDRNQLFMDVDDIPLGVDFAEYLTEQVSQCDVFLVVIGQGWIDAKDRLQSEDDFVRLEIEAALERVKVPIIPVLVDGATMPNRLDLPNSIQSLCGRNGINLRHESFAADVDERLRKGLDRFLNQVKSAKGNETKSVNHPTNEKESSGRRSFEDPANYLQRRALFRENFRNSDTLDASKVPVPDIRFDPGKIVRDIASLWCPEMVVIPAGTFEMGSTPKEISDYKDDHDWRECPKHTVNIIKSFLIGRYPVTFDEYDAFCNATGHEKPDDNGWGRGRRPAIFLSWTDCSSYCEWLSEKTGESYRLPSEAEWEYACRAGTTTAYSFGSKISTENANYKGYVIAGGSKGSEFRNKTVPVDYDVFQANDFGVFQMHGNVAEWCSDDFVSDYSVARTQSPIIESPREDSRVTRGGAWDSEPEGLRSASRGGLQPKLRHAFMGFRPARTILE